MTFSITLGLLCFPLSFFVLSIADRRKGNQGIQISHWHEFNGEAKVLRNENNEVIDVPYFHLETILAATDNFSDANKVGEGGFGPVYKVKISV